MLGNMFQPRSIEQTVYNEKCDLCFLDAYTSDGLYICLSCDCCVCKDHVHLHLEKSEHEYYVNIRFIEKAATESIDNPAKDGETPTVEYNREISLFSALIGQLSKDNCKNFDDAYLFARKVADADGFRFVPRNQSTTTETALDEFMIRCDHLDGIVKYHEDYLGEFPKVSKGEGVCGDCDIHENLWLCLTCGHLGCGREQVGCVGRGHALRHYNETGHSISVRLGTLSATRLPEIYCYSCDTEPQLKEGAPDLVRLLGSFGLSLSGEPTEKSLSQIEDEVSKRLAMMSSLEGGLNLPLVRLNKATGIMNVGCTCYASAAAQAIHACIDKTNQAITFEVFASHYKSCVYYNIRECFRCQEMRLMSSMESVKASSELSRHIKPDCGCFIPLACPSFAHERGALQDSSEFMMNWLQRTNILRQKSLKHYMRKILSCNSCGGRKCYEEEFPELLSVPIDATYNIGYFVDQAFGSIRCEGMKCPFCGAYDGVDGTEITTKTELLSAPKVVIVQPLRAVYTSAGIIKLEDNLTAPEVLDLSAYRASVLEVDEMYEASWEIRKAMEQSRIAEIMSQQQPEDICDKDMLAGLVELGIADREICRAALTQTNNNFELSADLILSGSVAPRPASKIEDFSAWKFVEERRNSDKLMRQCFEGSQTQPLRYELWAFVTHQGSSPQAGHYVCHTRLMEDQVVGSELNLEEEKDEEVKANHVKIYNAMLANPTASWVVFNDNRVAISPTPPIGQGVIYAYVHQPETKE